MGENRHTILLADGNQSNLAHLLQILKQDGFDVRGAGNLEELDRAIQGSDRPSLVVIDATSLDESVLSRCAELQEAKLPFFIILSRRNFTLEEKCFKSGVSALLTKPIGEKELLEHIHSVLVN